MPLFALGVILWLAGPWHFALRHHAYKSPLAQRAFGVYAFQNIDSLERRVPLNYSFGYSNGGPIEADFNIGQFSLYAQDRWNVSNKLTVTYGLRADVPQYLDNPVQNDAIAAAVDRPMPGNVCSWSAVDGKLPPNRETTSCAHRCRLRARL